MLKPLRINDVAGKNEKTATTITRHWHLSTVVLWIQTIVEGDIIEYDGSRFDIKPNELYLEV